MLNIICASIICGTPIYIAQDVKPIYTSNQEEYFASYGRLADTVTTRSVRQRLLDNLNNKPALLENAKTYCGSAGAEETRRQTYNIRQTDVNRRYTGVEREYRYQHNLIVAVAADRYICE